MTKKINQINKVNENIKDHRGGEGVDYSSGFHALNLRYVVGSKIIVRDVSLSFNRGEIVGLLGPNGAGKTTTFSMLSGSIFGEGKIIVDGENITRFPMHLRARLGIGYLPQESSVFADLTVEENILMVLEIVEKIHRKRKQRLEELLAEFSIDHIAKSKAAVLSGGERRRVEIARLVAMNPRYVLLDEPLAGIDPIAINDIRNLIIHLRDSGMGVLITDHNVWETLKMVEYAYIMYEGRVIKSGTPEDIVQDEEVKNAYLGKDFSL